MGCAAAINVGPDDLPLVVDALRKGATGPQGIVEGGISPAAVEEAVGCAAAVNVESDDLALVVDALRTRALAAALGAPQGIVEGDVKVSGHRIPCFILSSELSEIAEQFGPCD